MPTHTATPPRQEFVRLWGCSRAPDVFARPTTVTAAPWLGVPRIRLSYSSSSSSFAAVIAGLSSVSLLVRGYFSVILFSNYCYFSYFLFSRLRNWIFSLSNVRSFIRGVNVVQLFSRNDAPITSISVYLTRLLLQPVCAIVVIDGEGFSYGMWYARRYRERFYHGTVYRF